MASPGESQSCGKYFYSIFSILVVDVSPYGIWYCFTWACKTCSNLSSAEYDPENGQYDRPVCQIVVKQDHLQRVTQRSNNRQPASPTTLFSHRNAWPQGEESRTGWLAMCFIGTAKLSVVPAVLARSWLSCIMMISWPSDVSLILQLSHTQIKTSLGLSLVLSWMGEAWVLLCPSNKRSAQACPGSCADLQLRTRVQ